MVGQLSLFEGKRQRGRRAPPAKEFATHCLLADLLLRWCKSQWRYTHMPLGEKRTPATAGRLKRMGVTRGWPDFMFIGPSGVYWLELKRRGGDLSDEQEQLRDHLVACGHRYLCTSSLREAVDWLIRLVKAVPGLTLDWLFLGHTSGLSFELARRLAAQTPS